MLLNWKLTVFYLLLLPILVGLGIWQLYRADYKQGLQDIYEQRSAAAPIGLSELTSDQDVAYLQVQLQGRFDNKHYFLLDNRILNGRVGYEVVSSFLLEPTITNKSGEVFDLIWVNRGWIPMLSRRDQLPAVSPIIQRIILNGQLVKPSDTLVLADVPLRGQWPEIIQKIDLTQMDERFSSVKSQDEEPKIAPYLFRAAENQVGTFQVNWHAVNTSAQKSLGYAVQWFLMALVLTGLYFWAVFREK